MAVWGRQEQGGDDRPGRAAAVIHARLPIHCASTTCCAHAPGVAAAGRIQHTSTPHACKQASKRISVLIQPRLAACLLPAPAARPRPARPCRSVKVGGRILMSDGTLAIEVLEILSPTELRAR